MRYTIVFLLFAILASCDAAPTAVEQVGERKARSVGERKITGVLTLYNEGSSFHECALKEPWNCPFNKQPECGFEDMSNGNSLIKETVDKSGANQGYATFGVVMIGERVDGVTSGHLGAYGCEFRVHTALKAFIVPNVPPPE